MTAICTFDVFSSLDGFGAASGNWTGYWGQARAGREGPRFAFYGRVSTEDWQDPVMFRARQRQQAGALVAGHGTIVAAADLVDQLRASGTALTCYPDTHHPRRRGRPDRSHRRLEPPTIPYPGERRPDHVHSTRRGRRPGPGDIPACPETGRYADLTCPKSVFTK